MKLDYLDNVIIGCWQLAQGHSSQQLVGLEVLEAYYEAGFRVFDCADIYTGVEELLGTFIRTNKLSPQDIAVHTKYVPDLVALSSLSPQQTERAIDRSLARLGLERLDLVQFHWWDYRVPGYLETLDSLGDLKQRGKIREIGLTNFDARHLEEIIARGICVASLQTQYSILDRRPQGRLAGLAKDHGIALLCYGSVAGGLLSERHLGKEAPQEPYENRSLAKYMLILEEIGGWDALQDLLEVLGEIAAARHTDVATVACAYCLQREAVRACIVGVRTVNHLAQHLALRDGLELSPGDLGRIESVRTSFAEVPGAAYELERDRDGKHNKIMKFNLNQNQP
ncbi:MAG: aldo/keto reductase [Deinococcota bacterium]|jgi:aryl-alcohol dehydrogenase-like predicted oxidoreductase|nr:aldo/keto reductase [Deinococcota bacterium]MDQ3459362.1 aldo/keto reductase [Deinococcota bacterium]